MILRWSSLWPLILLLLVPLSSGHAAIYKISIKGDIDPITSDFVAKSIEKAESELADMLLIELDTPGGLGMAMQDIQKKMLNSRTPIVVYVAPSGARAASAGFFILMTGDVAAMAPGTNTGAAHPVLALPGGFPVVSEAGKPIIEKYTNDAVASLRSIVKQRGRNAELAEKAVRESKSYTETEALEGGLVEVVARNQAELLQKLDGRRVRMFSGQEVVLNTKDRPVHELEMDARQRFLAFISDPNIALLLFVTGVLLLYFEFTNPGFVAPGVIGAISLILALLGFYILPVNVVGVLLIILAFVLFILEVKVQGFGILGIGGIISMLIGALMLVETPQPELGIQLSTALAIVVPFAVILLLLLRLTVRAFRSRVTTGEVGLIGEVGTARTELNPEGKVFVHGEYWNAASRSGPIPEGRKVKVVAIDNLKLYVEELGDELRMPDDKEGQNSPAVEG